MGGGTICRQVGFNDGVEQRAPNRPVETDSAHLFFHNFLQAQEFVAAVSLLEPAFRELFPQLFHFLDLLCATGGGIVNPDLSPDMLIS